MCRTGFAAPELRNHDPECHVKHIALRGAPILVLAGLMMAWYNHGGSMRSDFPLGICKCLGVHEENGSYVQLQTAGLDKEKCSKVPNMLGEVICKDSSSTLQNDFCRSDVSSGTQLECTGPKALAEMVSSQSQKGRAVRRVFSLSHDHAYCYSLLRSPYMQM